MKKLALILLLMISVTALAQFNVPPKPKLQTSMYDYADMLSASEEKALEEKLIRYSDSTSTQIVIATVETINNEDINIVGPRWAHAWGIGQAKEDNGVFILLAKKERKVGIYPGYGVEHKLIAATNKQIIDYIITPEFRNGNFYGGLDKGSDAIFEVLKGTYKATKKPQKQKEEFPFGVILFIIIIIIFLAARGRRGGGGGRGFGNRGGLDLTDILILSSLG